MWLRNCLAIAVLLGISPPVYASTQWRGWDWLVERLLADGVDPDTVAKIFSDPRLPPFEGLDFSPTPPVESPRRYRLILRPETVRLARKCLEEHRSVLERAEHRTGVPAALLAALLTVETRCGQNLGRERVFYRLARLAMANEPKNVARNAARWCGVSCAPEVEEQLRTRARYLEATFYPEVKASIEAAKLLGVPVLELRGSSAGAFGWPQFLPRSFLRFGRDGNGDGRVDLFLIDDAALSAAEYLRAHGWERSATPADKRAALWAYNRSRAYGDAVLGLMHRLKNPDYVASDAPRKRAGVKPSGNSRGTQKAGSRSRKRTH